MSRSMPIQKIVVGDEYDNPGKVYVDVEVYFPVDGPMRPVAFTWEDGRRFEIDKVLDVRRAASQTAGGVGIRYTCLVSGREARLFFEEVRWFMERKGVKVQPFC